jgi:hypothetical protein
LLIVLAVVFAGSIIGGLALLASLPIPSWRALLHQLVWIRSTCVGVIRKIGTDPLANTALTL